MLLPNELVRMILKIKFNNFRRQVISKKFEKYKDCHEVWFTIYAYKKRCLCLYRFRFFSIDSYVVKLVLKNHVVTIDQKYNLSKYNVAA